MSEITNEEVDDIVIQLRIAIKKYESRVGTYLDGYWKEKNENKVRSAIESIRSLMAYYDKYGSLTPAQVVFAQKLLKNAAALK